MHKHEILQKQMTYVDGRYWTIYLQLKMEEMYQLLLYYYVLFPTYHTLLTY